ncbi:MAG: DNA polymerase III subunit beta [Clostridiales bacterium]|nr:DNA polymerase III subunit beta [Clostridiales bacterium]
MKFTCNQQILAKALNTVSKAVSTRTTLPILKGILIEAKKEGTITLTASDLEISIKKKINANIEEEGSIVVASKLFGDIIRKLPNEEIFIEETEEDSILIKTDSSEFKVVNLSVDEFPKIGDKEDTNDELLFNGEIFKDMVRKTSFAASIDETKGVLVGVLTEINNESVNMVALDSYRLALACEKMTSSNQRKFIIAAKIMNEIGKIITDENKEDDIKISLGEKRAIFTIGDAEVVLRLMEGDFIKYRDIIPQDNSTIITVSKELLQESIERASLLAKEGKNNLIKMTLKSNLMTITSRSEEGNVKEEIIMEKKGEDIEIGFNSKFIIDVLKAIEDEEISMNFKTGTSPCVVRPVEGNAYEYLILPVRIPKI